MVPNVEDNCETLRFNPLNFETVSLDENFNPDKSYFRDYFNDLKTEYFFQDETISHKNHKCNLLLYSTPHHKKCKEKF